MGRKAPSERSGANIVSEESEGSNVINLRQRRQEKRIAGKVKDCFNYVQSHGSKLSEEEYKDFIMLLLADLIVLVIQAGFYRKPATAIKNGVDWLAKRYGSDE